MTDRELMQQALDALTQANQHIFISAKLPFPPALNVTSKAAEALRARLAQPEQEPIATLFGSLPVYDVSPAKPVAWVENLENARPHCVTDLKYCSVAQHERGEHLKYIPLYTAPPQQHSEQWWRHEVSNAYAEGYEKGRVFCGCGDQIMANDGAECGNCVTARNAVKQEPIAQMREMLEVQGRDGTWNYDAYSQGMYNGMEFMMALSEGREPVFRDPPERWLHTPPQREWQTLTDEEIDQTAWPHFIGNILPSVRLIVRQLEAKLKEKNT